jgi:ADP-ribosyl-[dinitrogen reductase] hydrolase
VVVVEFEILQCQHDVTLQLFRMLAFLSAGGAGRGSQEGSIIGDVINHGKKKYWGVPNVHYHNCLKAGENTLNAQCARVVARSIIKANKYSPDLFLSDYVQFMTTPGTHNGA